MSKVAAWTVLLLVGCGRISFDGIGVDGRGGDATTDTTGHDGSSGDAVPAMSCASLAPTCGPTATSPCCESPVVIGGMYYRSYDLGADNAYADMTNPATVSTFRLDKYEVTVGRFRQFVNAGLGTQSAPPIVGSGGRTLNGTANQGGWDASFTGGLAVDTTALVAAVKCSATEQTWTDTPTGQDNRPINCITWYEAMAFCAWDGGFLPTEAEWNYAAAGGGDQRAYPWSVPASSLSIDGTHATYNDMPMTTVGSAPAGDGRWGQSDLAGNVWEWTLDWYASPYAQNPCSDCANLAAGSYRMFRGGGFDNLASTLREGYRSNVAAPTARGYDLGVRCARTPP